VACVCHAQKGQAGKDQEETHKSKARLFANRAFRCGAGNRRRTHQEVCASQLNSSNVVCVSSFLNTLSNLILNSSITLRCTPAMEASVADHVWSLEEIAELAE
jgi:hypothetical protein